MAGAKEIRTKIKSIQNTKKITKAMEMVAASKMRKAQERMAASKPYAAKMRQVISHLAKADTELSHPFLTQREVKRVGIIVVSTDRGLCGGLNSNLFRRVAKKYQELDAQGIEVDFVLIGKKAQAFFNRFGGRVIASVDSLGDAPHINDLIGTVKVMLDSFEEGGVDEVLLAQNEFVNSMTQSPSINRLVPAEAVADDDDGLPAHWDYIYEPSAEALLDSVLTRFVESQVYQGAVENVACEMAARMVAMKSATDNAGKLINELQLIYNKARQAAITQEIAEIVGGAAAV